MPGPVPMPICEINTYFKTNPFQLPPLTLTCRNLSPELYEDRHERNRLSGRQIVNKSFACICGKIWMKTMAKEIQSVLWKRCIKVIQDNTAAVRMT